MTIPGTMTLPELQKLVAESKGEWEHLEFKKTTGELHGGMETLCAFLNGVGGKVLFEVTNAGRLPRKEHANDAEKLEWIGVSGRVCSAAETKGDDDANDTGG
jgi:hypothetical protein